MDRFERHRYYARAYGTGTLHDGAPREAWIAEAIGLKQHSVSVLSKLMMTVDELGAELLRLGVLPDDEASDDEPDVGPTDRDDRNLEEARAHLQRVILADGQTDTGGRWLFDAAADEIVRLRNDRDDDKAALAGAHAELTRLRGEAQMAREALEQARAKAEKLRAEVEVDDRLLEHRTQLLDALPCPLHGPCVPHTLQEIARLQAAEKTARGQGAAEMRERAAVCVERMTNEVCTMSGVAILKGDTARVIRALPLDGAPTAAPGLTDDERATLRRLGYVERAGTWQHLLVGPAYDPAKPEELAELRRELAEHRDLDKTELSAEDAETLRAGTWRTLDDGRWVRPIAGAVFDPREAMGLRVLREKAAELRTLKTPAAAHGAPGKATGVEATAAGNDSVAEERGAAQELACECPPDVPAHDRCDRTWTRCNARLRALRPELEPQDPSPKRDVSEPTDLDRIEALSAELTTSLPRAADTSEPTAPETPAAKRTGLPVDLAEPTARDAVAGMLLRHRFTSDARAVCRGDSPQAVLASMATYPFTVERDVCRTALDALARGEIRVGPGHVSWNSLRTAMRRALGAGESESTEQAAQRVVSERDEARAEVAALREQQFRARGGVHELSALRREHQTDRSDDSADRVQRWGARRDRIGVELQRCDLTAFARGYLNGARDTWGSADVDMVRADVKMALNVTAQAQKPSGMRIEKRADGEYLVGAPATCDGCDDEHASGETCCHHLNGEHLSVSWSNNNGAEKILARWPIAESAPARDAESSRIAIPGAGDLHLFSVEPASRVDVIVPKALAPRSALEAVAELLGLPPPEYEIARAEAQATERGVEEGERRAKAKAKELVTNWLAERDDFSAAANDERAALKAGKTSRFMLGFIDGCMAKVGLCIGEIRAAFGIMPTGSPDGGPGGGERIPTVPGQPAADWTYSPEGAAHGSTAFRAAANTVLCCMRERAHDIANGSADYVARLIVARLAYDHGLAPRNAQSAEEKPVAAPDREALGRAVHEVWLDKRQNATGKRPELTFEDLDDDLREHDRNIGERLFAMGVQRGASLIKSWQEVARSQRKLNALINELDRCWVILGEEREKRYAGSIYQAVLALLANEADRDADVKTVHPMGVDRVHLDPGEALSVYVCSREDCDRVGKRVYLTELQGDGWCEVCSRKLERVGAARAYATPPGASAAATVPESPTGGAGASLPCSPVLLVGQDRAADNGLWCDRHGGRFVEPQGPTIDALRALVDNWAKRRAKSVAGLAETTRTPENRGQLIGMADARRDCIADLCRVAGIEPPAPAPMEPSDTPDNEGPSCRFTLGGGDPFTAAVAADVSRWSAALEREGRAHAAYRALAAQRDGTILLQASRLVRTEAEARLILSALGFAPGAADRVLHGEPGDASGAAGEKASPAPAGEPVKPPHNADHGSLQQAIDGWNLVASEGKRLETMLRDDALSPAAPETSDPRWEPGAVWEHRAGDMGSVARFEVEHLSAFGSHVHFKGAVNRVMRRHDMTEANGWRFVPAKPAQVKPWQVWRCVGVDTDHHVLEVETVAGVRVVGLAPVGAEVTLRARESDMLGLREWTFVRGPR